MVDSGIAPAPGPWTFRVRRPWTPLVWVTLFAILYAAVSVALSDLRRLEFLTTNWDLGIFQQALWSAGHGYPFYEVGDYETSGNPSYLIVHPSFVLFAFVPIYGLAPSALTLFILQSAAVAGAAFPLYGIGVALLGRPRRALVPVILYLAWSPLLASNVYDFHMEAFLPLELFGLVWLFLRERYRDAFAVAVVAFATLEVAPVLIFFVGLFFALEAFAATAPGPSGWLTPFRIRARALFRSRAARMAGVLMIASVVAYAALRYLELSVLYQYLGGHPRYGPAEYVAGGAPVGLTSLLPSHIVYTLAFWVILYALAGFLPVFAPRSFVLAVPWIFYTFWSPYLPFSTIGFEYVFVPAAPIFVGVVYGLARLDRGTRIRGLRRLWGYLWNASPLGGPSATVPPSGAFRSRRPRRVAFGVIALALLIVVNGLVGPLDPLRQHPFGGDPGYSLSYRVSPGFSEMQQLVALMPPEATVLASDDLFPFVANDVNAYALLWYAAAPSYLPFNTTHPPQFALIAANRVFAVPGWLGPMLYSASIYGLRGVVWTTPIGPTFLFELGYAGPPEAIGGVPVPEPRFFHAGNLVVGGAGQQVSDPGATFGYTIRTVPNLLAAIWYGPYVTLPAGSYTVTLRLKAEAANLSTPPNPLLPVLLINSTAFGTPFGVNLLLSFGTLARLNWTDIRFPIYLRLPATGVQVIGFLASPFATVELDYIELAPT